MSSCKDVSDYKRLLTDVLPRGWGTYLDKVDLREALKVARFLNVENRDDVLMIEISQKLHFTQGAETKHGMVEWCNFLNRDFLSRWLVEGRAATQMLKLAMLAV